MMYIAKCPLRISLCGGSTDLQQFIDYYGYGSVINFPSNLYVYISVHDNHREKYILNYSQNEEKNTIESLHNDVARVALRYFRMPPVTVSFLSDVKSTGSGLATSSAYMIALVKALSLYKRIQYTEYDICRIALQLEREFNSETGYQDPYGCGIGGFKKIVFEKDKEPSFRFYSSNFLHNNFDMALFDTNIVRNSNSILKDVDIHKSYKLLSSVEKMETYIESKNADYFVNMFKEAWEKKKNTSNLIYNSTKLKEWNIFLTSNENVLCFRLLGAGAGGYFFVLSKKGKMPHNINGSQEIPIQVNDDGVVGIRF